MKIWIDTEYNEFKGALISMALVSEDGREWYEVLPCYSPGEWVQANVMPILGKAPLSEKRFKQSLGAWLMQFPDIHLIADWPEDIAHFCNALITGPGLRLDTPPLTMEVRRDLDVVVSLLPHNALEDARAIRLSYNALNGPAGHTLPACSDPEGCWNVRCQLGKTCCRANQPAGGKG